MSEKLAPVYPDQQAQYPQYPQNPQYPPPYDQQQAQYPQPSQYPTYVQQQQPTVITVPGVAIGTTGNCPNCRNGVLIEEFDGCGICLAIFCFPLGLICCFLMRKKRCSNCRQMYE